MKNSRQKELLIRFLPYYRPYLRVLILSLSCAMLSAGCELVFPLIVRSITNKAVLAIETLTPGFILTMGGLYFVVRLSDALARYYMQAQGHIMGAHMERDMRSDLFSHLQQLSFSYYSSAKIGQIMARITSDLFEVTEFAHHCPEEWLIAATKLLASFVILCSIHFPLTLIVFALLPIMLFCVSFFNHRMRQTFKDCRYQLGEINAQVEDSLLGMRVVQSFTGEEVEHGKFEQGNETFLNLKKKQYHVMASFHSSVRFLDGMMNLLIVVLGAYFLSKGQITAGDFASYLLYINILLATVSRLAEFMEQYQRGMTGIERFYEIMDAPVEIHDEKGAKTLENAKGHIHFEDVSFSYEDKGSKVLSHLNFEVKPGQRVALVGPSGSGKTTLCNLIPRFYDVSQGAVMVDGQDVRHLSLKSLRSAIGMVQQDVYLFSGTVFENIAYGKPGASREEIILAAKRAGADEFIQKLPKAYDSFVGERGIKLSGGQKQRLSIARVFLKNPPILLLDEPTSALDNESERLVQESLEQLTKGRTTLTIAHRLTTIMGADVIWVLTPEGLMEHGRHEELIEKDGIYASLFRLYANTEKNFLQSPDDETK